MGFGYIKNRIVKVDFFVHTFQNIQKKRRKGKVAGVLSMEIDFCLNGTESHRDFAAHLCIMLQDTAALWCSTPAALWCSTPAALWCSAPAAL